MAPCSSDNSAIHVCRLTRVLLTVLITAGLVGTAGGRGLCQRGAPQSHGNGVQGGSVNPCGLLMLRLRGGYKEADKELQARMAAARAEVGAGWYNANASDLFPWDGWETHMRDEMEGAPHVGFLGGTGRWLGPSLEQVCPALMGLLAHYFRDLIHELAVANCAC